MTWQWARNMIKVPLCRFQQCFGTLNMLLLRESSQTGLFRHFSNYVFGVFNFQMQNLWVSSFLSNYLKFNLNLRNTAKNWEKFFFWDNCIWIGIVKFSLLRTGYFSSAASVLTSSRKNLHVNNRDSFQLNWIQSDQRIW